MKRHSCRFCRRIVVTLAGRKGQEKRGGPIKYALTEALEARLEGCALLSRALDVLGVGENSHEVPAGMGDDVTLSWLPSRSLSDSLSWSFTFYFSSGGQKTRLLTYDAFAEEDNAAAQFCRTRPMNPHPASHETFALAGSWLTECLGQHEHRQQTEASFTPRRLLQIRSENGQFHVLMLQRPETAVTPYVALSYCWGGDQPHKLTKEKADRNALIVFGELPKTIQDACRVTVELGYEYIWIDSLCIVQDDDEDKAEEIAKMSSIYSNATLTIAASGTKKVLEGFLKPRKEPKFTHELVELLCDGPNNSEGSLNFFEREWLVDPLETRAWALQESVLSTRILAYGSRQLWFYCDQTYRKPGYTDGWFKGPLVDHPTLALDCRALAPQSDQFRESSWGNIVARYTAREITMDADRILAISAIASIFENHGPGYSEYLAGVWRSHWPNCLLWFLRKETILPRPTAYQGPSWSWVGVNGPVEHGSQAYKSIYSESHLSLIDSSISLAKASAPYGAVRDVTLTVDGLVRPIDDREIVERMEEEDVVDENGIPAYPASHSWTFLKASARFNYRTVHDANIRLTDRKDNSDIKRKTEYKYS